MISRDRKSSGEVPIGHPHAELEDAILVHVRGLVDEHFGGFGNTGAAKSVILDVSGMVRMTSFGVRQWLRAIEALPKTVTDVYLLGCPTFFVDQLNMVLNFGGAAKVLTVVAPFVCRACSAESGEVIDVIGEGGANLAKGVVADKICTKCGGVLELDETAESFFAFASKYGATTIVPPAARLLATKGLYSSQDVAVETPPKIIKLVHGSVTYFRIRGTMAGNFRARPLLVGAEGEVVIDLVDVPRFDAGAHKEWRRLLRSLATQVPSITLVDLDETFFAVASDTLLLARNIAVSAVRVRYTCTDCGKQLDESMAAVWPLSLAPGVCTTCGGTTQHRSDPQAFVALQKVSSQCPPASAKLIAQRDEILSRAMTDAHVAEAGDNATASLTADDTILGKYKIVRPLSEGGMAEVFLAQQIGLGKLVALKRIQRKLLEQRHLAIDMFLNEAKIAGRLIHPNIVQVLDVGEVGGTLYLAMEYVHGRDLREVITHYQKTQQPIPVDEVCHILSEVALALHHAYFSKDIDGKQLAVVHRDVSPQNIILGYDGVVKLLDFGVAMSSVTEHATDMIVGKWRYMAPEATTKSPIDHRSDLFSVGIIAYLLCTNVVPFSGRDPRDILKKVRAGQYRPLQEAAPHIPASLATLIDSMLRPAPDQRPQSGMDVVAKIKQIAHDEGYKLGAAGVATILKDAFGIDRLDAPQIEILRPSMADSSLTRGSASMSSFSASPRPWSAEHNIPTAELAGGSHGTVQPPTARMLSAPPVRAAPPPPSPTLSRGTIIAIAIVLAMSAVLYFLVRPM